MNRTISTTVHLSPSEHELLSGLARRDNLKLSTFMRREVIRSATLSRDAAVVVGEIGRLGELIKRAWESAGIPMKDLSAAVNAIDGRVFVAQLQGVPVGE
jgi:hypothetical protein